MTIGFSWFNILNVQFNVFYYIQYFDQILRSYRASNLYKVITKTLKIMSIVIDAHKPYVCDPLGQYISLVNNSINLITLIDQPY